MKYEVNNSGVMKRSFTEDSDIILRKWSLWGYDNQELIATVGTFKGDFWIWSLGYNLEMGYLM
jgi:hypothetical protein